MRGVVGVAFAIIAMQATALADDAASLRTEGEDFAKRGQYAEAIEKFKAADRLEPRAQNACMIGLAYLRREIWVKAELFLARCRQRSRSGEPLPEWLGDAERQLVDGLAKANVTTVNIIVKPATAGASVRVSGFAPDETFDPQTIHLSAGEYTLAISSSVFPTVERKLTVAGTHDTVEVIVDLEAPPKPPEDVTLPPLPPPARSRGTGWLIAGASFAAAGVVSHIIASSTRSKLDDADTVEEYEKHETLFDVTRVTTFASYGVAAAALGVGLYLRLRSPDEDGARVVGAIASDGAFVGVEWRR